ncbi:MAG: diguanylate cyclase [Magnetococcales bacterium]|nr:diguanylate cyclase [Magnetococcales bacterium]
MNICAPTGQKSLILIVDDDAQSRDSLAAFLEQNGYDVATVKDGQEALHFRTLTIPDLILLDVLMPNLDGLATCRALRKESISPRIPIIMLTGLFDAYSVDHAFEAGADDYVTKPIHWAVLRQRIRLHLERRDMEARIRHQATFDPLTDLPNRTLFLDRLQHAISMAVRNQESLALLFVDLDHFKEVNDTLGHAARDELLRQAGIRLKHCVRHSDTLARLGGDEFTIIISNVCQPPEPQIVAEKIRSTLSLPFDLHGRVTSISASIGITLFPTDADSLETLLLNADQAMYQAKNLGRNRYQFFTPP